MNASAVNGAAIAVLVALAAAAAPTGAVVAEERSRAVADTRIGDPDAGRTLAREACASCHAIAPGDTSSPEPDATPFDTLAQTPGITGRALNVWLTTFHPERTMPAIVLTREERENIIAYIVGLGDG